MNEQSLIKLAEATYELISSATEQEELKQLVDMTMEVAKVLESSGLHPDLGLDLREFSQLKQEGQVEMADKERGHAAEAIDSLKEAVS